MRQLACLALAVALAISLWTTAGCEESEGALSRRARLVADENLKLKEQLRACRAEVQQQQQLLAESQKTSEQIAADSGEANIKLLKALGELGKQVETLSAENQRLKAQLEAVKNTTPDTPVNPAP